MSDRQSDECMCIKTIRGMGAIREKHTDTTGGGRRRLASEKVGVSRELLRTAGVSDEFVAKHGTRSFAVMSPLISEIKYPNRAGHRDIAEIPSSVLGSCTSCGHCLMPQPHSKAQLTFPDTATCLMITKN